LCKAEFEEIELGRTYEDAQLCATIRRAGRRNALDEWAWLIGPHFLSMEETCAPGYSYLFNDKKQKCGAL
jgi:hypothetical protein